jgi:signal transduction histidine kinase
MQAAAPHPNESQRLAKLLGYEVLDTDAEASFDELTELASAICGTPISLISLVDEHRQWFKSKVGLGADQTDRSLAFCAHAILQDGVFEVPNALEDPRFHDNPLVTDQPDIRFYAGAPLISPDGHPLGTLCVIDTVPKELSPVQRQALQTLAKQVISQLELRVQNRRLERLNRHRDSLYAILAHDLRSPFNGIMGLSKILSQRAQRLSPEKIADAAKGILSSSVQVYQMLDELLQWSQLTLGAVQSQPVHGRLWPLVEDTLNLLQQSCELKGVEIQNQVCAELSATQDPIITKMVLRNLLANAVKYSPAGGCVQISGERQGNEIWLRVRDQGPGVPEALREQLFSQCLDSQLGSGGEKGLGMGLMLCQQFLQRQQGRLWLEDQPEGACFVFSLPAV